MERIEYNGKQMIAFEESEFEKIQEKIRENRILIKELTGEEYYG